MIEVVGKREKMPVKKAAKRNKREDRRRQVTYLLRHADGIAAGEGLGENVDAEVEVENGGQSKSRLVKEDIPSEVAKEYFQYILNNNISKFGIVKLHRFNLNKYYSASGVGIEWSHHLVTLMMFANSNKRDKIVSALVHCGVDPSIYPDIKDHKTFDVTTSLTELPPSYCVWLIRKLYGMADAAIELVNDQVQTKMCCVCKESDDKVEQEGKNELNIGAIGGTVIDNKQCSKYLLKWDCGHSLCWECTWKAACRPLPSTDHAFRCPLQGCLKRCDGGDDDFFTTLSPPTEVETFDLQQQQREIRKRESFAKWQLLPETLIAYDKKSSGSHERESASRRNVICPKKPILKAQPFHVCAGQYLGTIRPQRVLELHKASIVGNLYRMHALLEAGVDVDGVNDYGQSALFLACRYVRVDSVRYLLWAGANIHSVDNSGCDMWCAVSCSNRAPSSQSKCDITTMLNKHTKCTTLDDKLLSSIHLDELRLDSFLNPSPNIVVTSLIPADSDHVGAGACYIDSCFSDDFIGLLVDKFNACPVSPPSKQSCSSRSYYCDTDGVLSRAFENVLNCLKEQGIRTSAHSRYLSAVFPLMRFLCYSSQGGWLPPHEDLSRSDDTCIPTITSTHTFILYLTTCVDGGETNLLSDLGSDCAILARVKPVRGRLLLFPHQCPHEGAPAESLPKILLRGEVF